MLITIRCGKAVVRMSGNKAKIRPSNMSNIYSLSGVAFSRYNNNQIEAELKYYKGFIKR